jgi:hypothetical protein
MQLVRLTRQPRVRLRQPPTRNQRPPLQPARHRHLHLLAHPVRVRSQPLALRRLRHPPASKMNVGTIKPNLVGRGSSQVGRGSRSTDDCLRSSRLFKSPNFARPMDPPSRRPKMCHLSRRDSNFQRVFQFSSPWVRLGKPVGLSHHEAGIDGQPCEYQAAIPEPRPTSYGPATSHFSLFTSHFSPPAYACS